MNTDNCDSNAKCSDVEGSFRCSCNVGFSGNGTFGYCAGEFYFSYVCMFIITILTDIDECVEESDGCHSNATCVNTIGSYNCTCNDGFDGNGVSCESMIFQCYV